MKKLLVVMMWSASLGAMEIPVEQQQQLQEGMITVDFGDKSSQEVARKYVLLSSVLKNQIEDTNGNTVLVPHKSAFELLGAYLPKLYELQQATSNQDRERIRNELKALLTRKQDEELVVTNEQLGIIANMANYLEIEFMSEIALQICRDRLASDTNIKNQFLTSKNPEAFNPFGLNETLLVYLRDMIVHRLYLKLQALPLPTRDAAYVAWSPDGNTLAVAANELIYIFEEREGGWRMAQNANLNAKLSSLAWSPDGTILVSGGDDAKMRFLVMQDGRMSNPNLAIGDVNHGPVISLAWRHNMFLAAGSERGMLSFLWSPFPSHITNFPRGDRVFSVAWKPDGQQLAVGVGANAVNSIELWSTQLPTAKLRETLPIATTEPRSLAWSPNGKILASSSDTSIALWQERDDKLVVNQTLIGHDGPVSSLAWNPDGTALASSSHRVNQAIKLWFVRSDQAAQEPQELPVRNAEQVYSLAWNNHGILASGSSLGISLWTKFPYDMTVNMTLQQALLLFYGNQALENNQQQLNLVQYPKLLELYKSLIETLSDKPEIKKYITTLFKVANMQP